MSDIKNKCYKELITAVADGDSEKFIQICNNNEYKDCIKDVINKKQEFSGNTIFHTIVDSFNPSVNVYKALINFGADTTIKNYKEQTVIDILKAKQNDIIAGKNVGELFEYEKRIYNDIEEKINIIEGRDVGVSFETKKNTTEEINNTVEQQVLSEEKNNSIEKEEINITPVQDNENNEEEKKNAEMLEKINKTLSEIEESNLSASSVIFNKLEGIDDKKLKEDFITGVLTKKDDRGLTLIERTSANMEDNFMAFGDLVKLIQEYVPDMIKTERYFDGDTVLHLLCGFDNNNGYRELTDQSRIVEEILLKNKESIELLNNDNETPLFVACRAGNDKMVKLLVEKGANIFAVNNNNETPLFEACKRGDLEIVKFLVEKGADVFAVNKGGKDAFSCIEYKYGNGVDVEQFLSGVIEQKKLEICEQIKKYIDNKEGEYNTIESAINNIKDNKHIRDIVQSIDTSGETLLFKACRAGNLEVVRLLVENGANVFAENRQNKNVFDITDNDDVKKHVVYNVIYKHIRSNSITNIENILNNKYIKQYVPSVFQMKNTDGESLLFEACRSGNIGIVKLLIENGADVYLKNNKEESVIDILEKDIDNTNKKIIKGIIQGYIKNDEQKSKRDNILENNIKSNSNEYLAEYLEKQEIKQNGEITQSIQSDGKLQNINTKENISQQIQEQRKYELKDDVENKINQEKVMELYNNINELIKENNFKEINNIINNEKNKEYLKDVLSLQDERGETLLFKACEIGNINLIQLLLENGVDVFLKNKDGKDVNDILEGSNIDDEYKKIISGIINGYIKNNKQNDKKDIITDDLQDIGQTEEKIENLYNKISNYVRDGNKTELIRTLNESENKLYIKQVLNAKNNNGDNIFQLACRNGFDNDTLYLLVQNDADIFTRNNLNKDALDNVNNPTTKQYLNELRIQKIKSQAEEYIINKDYYNLSLLVRYHGETLWKQTTKEQLLEKVNEEETKIVSNIFTKQSIKEDINRYNAYDKALECILNKDYYNLSLILNKHRIDIIESMRNGDESIVLNDIPTDFANNTNVYRKQKKNGGYNLMDVAYLCNDDIVKQILEKAKIYKDVIDLEELDRRTRVNNYRNIIKFYIENDKKEELEEILENTYGGEFLIEALNIVDKNGETLLFGACRKGDMEIVKLLLDNGANISVINNNNETPLFDACRQGNIEIVKFLVENGVNILKQNANGENILNITNNESIITYIKEQQDKINEYYKNINNYIQDGQIDNIQQICLNEENKYHILLALNLQNEDGETPLFGACRKGDIEIVKLLLDNGANISVINNNNETPLFAACRSGNIDIVKFLVENDVDITIQNNDGKQIFDYVDMSINEPYNKYMRGLYCKNYNDTLKDYIKNGEFNKEVLNALSGTEYKDEILNLQDENGETLLFEACRQGNIEIVELLIENGADISVINNNNETPLFEACRQGNIEIVKLLVENGADVTISNNEDKQIFDYVDMLINEPYNKYMRYLYCRSYNDILKNDIRNDKFNEETLNALSGTDYKDEILNLQDENGETLLFEACRKGNFEVVKLLVENGANVGIKNKDGKIALDCVNENKIIIDYLLYGNINELIKEKKYGEINNIINDEKNREFIRDVLKWQDENGETLLFQACRSGNIQVVELLLNKEGEFGVESVGILNNMLNKDEKDIFIVLDEEIERLGEENSSDIKVVRGYIHGYVDKYVKENMPLKWSEISKDIKYKQKGIANNKDVVTHKDAQQQVYQIAYYYANNPIKDIDQNKTYAISDTHGDMGALLESLLRSGTVEFVNPEEPCIVVVNNDNPDNKILIPNVRLTEKSNGNKLVVLGDIIDRGYQTDSCIMLMKHLMNQQTQQKSNNIIFTVGNHEDMTINDNAGGNTYFLTLDENSVTQGKNKDHNTARDIFKDMVEQNQMLFCYYDENTNTIYSHVPFDIKNTVNALNFIQNNKNEFSEQTQQNVDKIAENWSKNQDFFKDNKKGVKQLVDVFNELYKYKCEYKDEKLHNDVYEQFNDTTVKEEGLLWNRDYTEDKFKAIPGINCVCGHDPKKSQDVKVNKDGSIINIDTIRSCGYTTDKNQVGFVEISQGENGKLSHKVLEDIGHIKYSKDLKTIETINKEQPVILQENTVFIKKNINSLVSKDLSKQEIQTDNVKQQQENNSKTQLTKKEEKERKKQQKKEEKERKKQQKKEEKERKKREKEEEKRQKSKMKMQDTGASGGKHSNNQILSQKKHGHRFLGFVKKILYYLFDKILKKEQQNTTNAQYHSNNYSNSVSYCRQACTQLAHKEGILKKARKKIQAKIQHSIEKHKEKKEIKEDIKELNKELIKEIISKNGNIAEEELRREINNIYFPSFDKHVRKQYGIETSTTQLNSKLSISNELITKVDNITKKIDNYRKKYYASGKENNNISTYNVAISKFAKSLSGVEVDSRKKDKQFIKDYKETIKEAKQKASVVSM